MKNVKAYYTEDNRLYVQKEVLVLGQHSIVVETVDATTLPRSILTPSFVVYKNGGMLAKLEGKFTPGIVLDWVQKHIKDS